MSKDKKQPNPIDVFVGSRVRLKRSMADMSQERLGEQLGITFQQVQKYEKGTNRIGASRMQDIANVLETSVGFFFEGAPGSASADQSGLSEESANYVVDFLSSSEGLQLNKAFVKIRDPLVRRKIIELVSSLSQTE